MSDADTGGVSDADTGSGVTDAGSGNCGLYAAVDVHYLGAAGARAALVAAVDRRFSCLVAERTALVPEPPPYCPGNFYLREVPALRAVLDGFSGLAMLVVDGYVDLNPAGQPGLGAHMHKEYGVPVIGVAKSAFLSATHAVPVLRGRSARPLFVTSAGIGIPEAVRLVSEMSGQFRLPDALRRADALSRGRPESPDVPATLGRF